MSQIELDRMLHVTFPPEGTCNSTDVSIREQVAANIRRGLPQAKPYLPNNNIVALVCGGPSLIETEKELVEAYWAGAKVVAVNGAYQWCIDKNIKPSAMVMLDARPFNAKFVKARVPDCKYLLASQCHPDAFKICEMRDVTIWHACSSGQEEFDMLKTFYGDEPVYPIAIGTTVAIRAISLLRLLGFQAFDIFGLDSCWTNAEHHAYKQTENDVDQCIPVWLRPKGRDDLAQCFYCSPWMMRQAQDFQELVRRCGDSFRLSVRGNGMIATIMRTAAEMEMA
jgi:hypothetical protein